MYDMNNPHFKKVAEAAHMCADRNGGCEGCQDEAACKIWWDNLAIEVETQEMADMALEEAPISRY